MRKLRKSILCKLLRKLNTNEEVFNPYNPYF